MTASRCERRRGFVATMKPLALAIAAALSPCGEVLALPTGEQVVAGQVGVSRPTPQSMVVQQGSPKAIVNWQGFSIGGSESVNIQQPGASSVILNRVVGNNASEIYGRLSANGQVFLVNPSGVLFGRTAMVDVGALVASTLSIGNDDFLAGRYRFTGNGKPGLVENRGTLAARDGGFIALLGGQVSNSGTISARLGTAGLAAGNKMTLDFAGDGLVRIAVDEAALAAEVRNQGAVIADGGQAILSARSAEALTQTVVNQTGVVRARTLVERQGKIVLDGGTTGQTLASGTLDASGAEPGQKGGEIQVLGHHVGITGKALLDASGEAGGGSVLVGGDFQGRNPAIRNASATWFGPDATIRADASGQGDGGKVIVWSDEATRAHGTITARGGAQGGDGGFVETSGKFLEAAGIRVNASAPNGAAGEWLLDPFDLTILIISPVCANVSGCSETPVGPTFESVGTGAILPRLILNQALDTNTNVTVQTGAGGEGEGNITIAANTTISRTAAGDATLRLNAHNNIIALNTTRIESVGGRLNVEFNSDSDGNGSGAIALSTLTIQTNGGDVRMFGGTDPVNGRAQGNDVVPHGVALIGTTINTVPAAGGSGGAVVIRGQGGSRRERGAGSGIFISDTNIATGSGNLTLDGVGGSPTVGIGGNDGMGVFLLFESALRTGSGKISVTGVGGAAGPGSVGGTGVRLNPRLDTLETTAGGDIEIRGRGGAGAAGATSGVGVSILDETVRTQGSPGTIVISGESPGTAAGVLVEGSVIGGPTSPNGPPGTSGNIVIRATNVGNGDSIQLDANTTIQTTGNVNLRPGGVDAAGNPTAADANPIAIAPQSAAAASAAFRLSPAELNTIQDGTAGIVIGSNTHTGPISVLTAHTFRDNVTLQNAGAGSQGIALEEALSSPGNLITLSSAGPVTQAATAPITAGSLLLQGTGAGSNFLLRNVGNAVSQFAAASPVGGQVQFENTGALTIGPLAGTGFDSASNTPTPISAPNTVSFGDLFVRTTGDLTIDATIRRTAAGDATLRLNAHNNIIAQNTTRIESVGGRLNVEFNSDSDGNGSGAIALSTLTIQTNGGDVRMFGGTDPVNGRARGNDFLPHGVALFGTTIDTVPAAGGSGGAVVIRGEGGDGFVGSGILIGDTNIATGSGNLTLDGVGGSPTVGIGGDGETGVSLVLGSSLRTGSGRIFITGLGGPPGPGSSGGPGVSLTAGGDTLETTAGGDIEIRGRGGAGAAGATSGVGVSILDETVRTQGSPGTIVISGESPGTAAGVLVAGSVIGGPGTSGNIVIRATNAGNGDSIQLDANTTIQTTGNVNLRPGGVNAVGILTAADADAIEIAPPPEAEGVETFRLSPAELNTIQDGTAGIVIGSNTHTGPISVLTAYTFRDNVTLQNAGAGSQGIALEEALSSRGNLITLSSAGPVTQAATAPITAGSLLLQGTGAGSNFLLRNVGNAVSQFAAASPVGGQVQFENTGALTIGPLAGTGFDSASNTPTPISAPNTVSFGDLFVRTTGNLSLAHSISTIGSDIDLVTGGIFNNAGGVALLPGGAGSWQVWATTWEGENRGGLVPTSPFPNFYGCAYPGTCPPDVTIPITGNHFIYQDRPTLTFVADDKSRPPGLPNPPFTATSFGLVNGDTLADAVVASLSSPATPTSPAGTYPINVTGAFSPVGYNVNTRDGTLSVPDIIPPRELTDSGRWISNDETLLYARNLGTPFMCTPSGPLAVPASVEEGSDNLAREWGRVRIRPNLTNCLGLSERGGCDDF